MSDSKITVPVTDESFTGVVEKGDGLVVVDFWAAWCGPCKALGPVLERLAAEADGRWALVKVDADRHQDLVATYGVRGIPAVRLFVDGKVAHEFTGALPEHAVRQWLSTSLPDPARRELDQAAQRIAEGKGGEAAEILERILEGDNTNEQARVLLATVILHAEPERARALVEGIEEHRAQFATADAVRTIAGLIERTPDKPLAEGEGRESYMEAIGELKNRNYDAAIAKFIGVIRNDRYYDDDGSRRACVALFHLLGDENEITRRHRREFSSALYS